VNSQKKKVAKKKR